MLIDLRQMGRISRIDEMKSSRNGGAFRRVYFQMKDNQKSTPEKKIYFWAKTDLVPTFRNYKHWKDVLKVGNILSDLQLKTEDTVDADSIPRLLGRSEQEPDIAPLQETLWK